MSGLRYTCLSEPSKQIRLLRLLQDTNNSTVKTRMSTHDLIDVPPFAAISYTWGPPEKLSTIEVDDRTWTVRENCAYALWQVRLHPEARDNYIWIDSICINQDDPVEKSHQVAIMGHIYGIASQVLACIGDSDEHSDYILRAVHDIDSYVQKFPEGLPDLDELEDDEIRQMWNPPQGDAVFLELANHWGAFDQRHYFSRLWIAQEVHGGHGRTQVLFGKAIISWTALCELDHRLFLSFLYHPEDFYWQHARFWNNMNKLLKTLAAARGNGNSVRTIFERQAKCQDPRDCVYGNLSLINWDGLEKPFPDYTISSTILAFSMTKTLKLVELQEIIMMATALGVTLEGMLSEKIISSKSRILDRQAHSRRSFQITISNACLIYQDSFERLCVDLYRPFQSSVQSPEVSTVLPDDDSAVQLFTNGCVSAVTCQQPLSGDFFVNSTLGTFILRPQSENGAVFKLIGRAILVNGHMGTDLINWNCRCWAWEREVSKIENGPVLQFELSDAEAFCMGAVASIGDHTTRLMSELQLDVPEPGSIVLDHTAVRWGDEPIKPLEQDCSVHGWMYEDDPRSRHALSFVARANSGGFFTRN